MPDSAAGGRQHVADPVSRAEVGTLTTAKQEERHVSRPRGPQAVESDGNPWFLADDDSAGATRMRPDPEVNVSFPDTGNHSWTSLAVRAQIVHDRRKVEQLHSPTPDAWFPDGLGTPGPTPIEVEADTAEYWEGPTSTVARIAGNLRAAATGNPGNDPIRDDTVEP